MTVLTHLTTTPRRAVHRLRVELPSPWGRLVGRIAHAPALLRSADARRTFREETAIERLVADGLPLSGQGVDCSERVVEIPWVLRRLPRPAGRLLDVGTAFAPVAYQRELARLPAEERHGVDLADFELAGVAAHSADVRALPFADDAFDRVVCISTLEHIGLDNQRYFAPDGRPLDESGDVTALRELARVTRPDGRVLVTVPGGAPSTRDWYRQYSAESWAELVARAGLAIERLDCFEHDSQRGWQTCAPEAVARRDYEQGAVAAAAVICSELRPA